MSAPTPLFTFRPIPTIAGMLESRGIAVIPLLDKAGLPHDAITSTITAPLVRIQAFVDDVAEQLDAPLLGLDLVDLVPLGSYGVAEFAVHSAPSIEVALSALCELSPLLNPLNDMRYIADASGCEIHFSYAGLRDSLGMQLNEYTIALIARHFQGVLGKPLALERAWFAHGRRERAEEVARRLDCNVAFQKHDSGFALTSDVIAHRPANANPALFDFLLTQARAQLANMGGTNIVAQTVRTIEARLAVKEVTASAIAEAMATTERTLQRHLAEAGTSFRDVLTRVRLRRRAELERADLTETEIATRLGFANARTMKGSLDTPPDDPT
ncbi:MAG TPA: AraC family transcriptional regulator ligand-binding domain-containing protein [Kofleriaceae bacterium]|jgi:AraC-like DNA-binding protein